MCSIALGPFARLVSGVCDISPRPSSASNTPVPTLDDVVRALRTLRFVAAPSEREIQRAVARALVAANIPFKWEHRLGPRNVIDFLVTDAGIGIEVKKGKPGSTRRVMEQVERYAKFGEIRAMVVVVEGKLHWHPDLVEGKPLVYLPLAKLWGVAL